MCLGNRPLAARRARIKASMTEKLSSEPAGTQKATLPSLESSPTNNPNIDTNTINSKSNNTIQNVKVINSNENVKEKYNISTFSFRLNIIAIVKLIIIILLGILSGSLMNILNTSIYLSVINYILSGYRMFTYPTSSNIILNTKSHNEFLSKNINNNNNIMIKNNNSKTKPKKRKEEVEEDDFDEEDASPEELIRRNLVKFLESNPLTKVCLFKHVPYYI